MKNHRFLWLRNRTTDNRKCEKARNIKEKRTIEMFNTASKPLVALPSSASDNLQLKNAKKARKYAIFWAFSIPKFCLDCSVLADDGGAREPGVWFDPRVVGGGQGILLCKRCGKSVGICESLRMVCI